MLPMFIEDCNRLLPDRVADAVRCRGLWAYCTCSSACKQTLCPEMPCLGNDARSFSESFIWSQKQFLN